MAFDVAMVTDEFDDNADHVLLASNYVTNAMSSVDVIEYDADDDDDVCTVCTQDMH